MATTAALAQISNLAARYTSTNFSRVLPGQKRDEITPPHPQSRSRATSDPLACCFPPLTAWFQLKLILSFVLKSQRNLWSDANPANSAAFAPSV